MNAFKTVITSSQLSIPKIAAKDAQTDKGLESITPKDTSADIAGVWYCIATNLTNNRELATIAS